MSTREQLEAARKYIQIGEYNRARRILKMTQHPTADKWLKQLDAKYPQSKFRQSNRIKFWIVLVIILAILALFLVAQEKQRTANFRLETTPIELVM